MKDKGKHAGKPVQVYLDEGLKIDFERMVGEYDSMLSTTKAIRKLILHAVTEHWLPGYIRKSKTIENKLGGISRPPSALDTKLAK